MSSRKCNKILHSAEKRILSCFWQADNEFEIRDKEDGETKNQDRAAYQLTKIQIMDLAKGKEEKKTQA